MEIILTGSVAIDRIMSFKGKFADLIQPDKLHVLSISILLDELKDTRGGIAANIAYNLALLGDHPVLLGSVGKDGAGYMQRLAELGVQTDQVHYSQQPTATFTVMTDMADCQVGGFYPGAMSDAESLSLSHALSDAFVVISPHDPTAMRRQVAECRERNMRMFYDVGQQVTNIPAEDIKAGIEAAELLIVNDYELGVIAEKTGWSEAEIKQKVTVCIVTLGEKGCEIYQGAGEGITVLAARISKLADPTGAGDAFRAGFLYGYTRNWDVAQAAQLGAVVAAYAVEHHGTQEHFFTPQEIEQRYNSNYQPLPKGTL